MAHSEQAFSVIKLSYPERPTDRYLRSEVEQLSSHNHPVILVGAIEISNRWQGAIDVGNTIWATFVKSYQESPSRSLLTKFESALKVLNTLLDGAGDKIVEPIHCALAIFAEGNLYFSAINNGHVLLWRRQKLSQITGPHLAGERFASVTSGELKDGDWLIVGSSELREVLKNGEPAKWPSDEPKVNLLRRLAESIDPAGYDQLSGIAIEPSQQSQLETIRLQRAGSKTPITLPQPAIIWGKIRYQLAQAVKWLAPIFRRREPANAPAITAAATEQISEVELPVTPTKRKRFPIGIVASVAVLALIIAGVIIIRNEFHKVSKAPTVAVPTIAALIKTTPTNQVFSFIEQNLTIDNFNNLSAADKTAFTQTLQNDGVKLLTSSAQAGQTDSPILALDNSPKNLYAVDSAGSLWRYESAFTKVASQTPVQNAVGVAVLSDGKIVISDQTGQLWLWGGTSSAPTAIPLPPDITQGQKLIQKFGSSNLYMYQVTTGNVYKIAGFIKDIAPAADPNAAAGTAPPTLTPFITSSVLNFGTLAAWAVPGDFVGATADGVVRNFTKSKLENLNVQYYHDNNAIHLSLTGQTNEFAVARGKFVSIHSTTDGHKISEFALLTNDAISAVSPGPGGSVYVAAGKTLYKLP